MLSAVSTTYPCNEIKQAVGKRPVEKYDSFFFHSVMSGCFQYNGNTADYLCILLYSLIASLYSEIALSNLGEFFRASR